MTELTKKESILENAGYTYQFERMIYVNPRVRRAFSLEYVEDHSRQEIEQLINEPPTEGGWVFHFNEPPSENIKRQLAHALGR